MTVSHPVTLPSPPASVTLDKVRVLEADTAARADLLRQIVRGFERKYQCSLETFEERLENREIPEHPSWEDSIEWRNAIEQLERIETSRNIFAWLNCWLVQSAALHRSLPIRGRHPRSGDQGAYRAARRLLC
jgi:hypothetical protein